MPLRGGCWNGGSPAGVFAFLLDDWRFLGYSSIGVRAASFFWLIDLGIGRFCRCAVAIGILVLLLVYLRLICFTSVSTVLLTSASEPLFSLLAD